MSAQERSTPHELSEIESRLRQLRPARIGPSRDALLYEAGRAASAGVPAMLAAGSTLLLILLLGLSAAWWTERTRRKSIEVELANLRGVQRDLKWHELDGPPAPLMVANVEPGSYLALRSLLDQNDIFEAALHAGAAADGSDPIERKAGATDETLRARDVRLDF